MYIANHYVRVGQDLLKKGDLIPSDLPEDKIKWLLEAGAIQKATVPLKFYGHAPVQKEQVHGDNKRYQHICRHFRDQVCEGWLHTFYPVNNRCFILAGRSI